jgi:hypothetical protein
MQLHRVPIGPRTALAAAGCAIALAACGSSGSTRNASADRSPAALPRCMRANGVSGFPDPKAGPNGAIGLSLMLESPDSLTAGGISFAGPAVQVAEKACKAYLPPAGGPPANVQAQQLRHELTLARCMRDHGVPNFPDPASSSGGEVGLPAGLDPQSPAFRSAARECGAGDGGTFESAG